METASHDNRSSLDRWSHRKRSNWLVGLIVIVLALSSCVAPPIVTTPTVPSTTETTGSIAMGTGDETAVESAVLVHTDDAIIVPDVIPAGLRRIVIQNDGANWHATIMRRLKEDVTMEEFTAAFQENPFGSLPLTVQLGGPDLPPGTRVESLFLLEPGDYVVVDNWTTPPRMQPFSVAASDASDDSLPEVEVNVEMREHEFIMPATISSGPQWWVFRNTGDAVHQLGIARLAPDKTLDDIAIWLETEEGPMPWEDIAFWNVMSPGQVSWGEMDLPPGTYMVLDYLPDFANGGAPNFALGMAMELEVSE